MTHYLIKVAGCFAGFTTSMGPGGSPTEHSPWPITSSQHIRISPPRVALSGAYIQCYKNAIQTEDQAAVEANMKLALNAARAASQLDLTSETAQQAVYTLQRKLLSIRAKP